MAHSWPVLAPDSGPMKWPPTRACGRYVAQSWVWMALQHRETYRPIWGTPRPLYLRDGSLTCWIVAGCCFPEAMAERGSALTSPPWLRVPWDLRKPGLRSPPYMSRGASLWLLLALCELPGLLGPFQTGYAFKWDTGGRTHRTCICTSCCLLLLVPRISLDPPKCQWGGKMGHRPKGVGNARLCPRVTPAPSLKRASVVRVMARPQAKSF